MMIERSASGLIPVQVSVAQTLLAVSDGEVTHEVLTRLFPEKLEATLVTSAMAGAEVLAAKSCERLQVTDWPLALHVQFASLVAETKLRFGGRMSVTWGAVASDGPALCTESE